MELTETQKRLYDYLAECIARDGRAPSLRQAAAGRVSHSGQRVRHLGAAGGPDGGGRPLEDRGVGGWSQPDTLGRGGHKGVEAECEKSGEGRPAEAG